MSTARNLFRVLTGAKFSIRCRREIVGLQSKLFFSTQLRTVSAGTGLVNAALQHQNEFWIQKRCGSSIEWIKKKKIDGISEKLSFVPFDCVKHIMAEDKGGKMWDRDSQKDKKIALFTSGGDSQGMNAALRAIVRMGLYLGCKMFFIKEGYQGMVDGGQYIVEATWASVSSIIHMGGTIIGSARCQDFRTRGGQLKAAKNLVQHGIQNLIVIGGDGTLTGADSFRTSWPSLLDELLQKGEITAEQRRQQEHLNIAGLVGSIDNDFCGTDMTIGSDSALHRIVEAVDAIAYTAYSHKRTFIMEVMGRHCGFLALTGALASEADYVFVPESPAPTNWQEKLGKKLLQEREAGKRLNIIIVAEGAIDQNGKPITAEQIKNSVVTNLQQDARVTILGHIQRGGRPSAFDRVLGSRMGAEALMAICESTPQTEPCVITLSGNQAIRLPLMDCVNRTKDVAKAMAAKEFPKAVELRGKSFTRNLETFKMLTRLKPPETKDQKSFTFGVVLVGSPACGINAAVRSFVRNLCYHGHQVAGIHNGFEGFTQGFVKPLGWSDVIGWATQGGAIMGIKRSPLGNRLPLVAAKIEELKLHGLLIIGGFAAYEGALRMYQSRNKYPQYNIPIAVIPATISNNVPGTEFSLGCDTALNEITEICDDIRQSAAGTKRRVFIVETMGGYCGYLATLAGLGAGADSAYIFEEKQTIKDLQEDVSHMATKMAGGIQRGLVLRNEHSSRSYDTSFIHKLYAEEGRGLFSARMNVLGHMQQGGSPSPFDRNQATKMGAKAANWMASKVKDFDPSERICITGPDTVVVIGIVGKRYRYSPVESLAEDTDFEHRLPKTQWWLKLRPLLRILAHHDSIYEEEGVYLTLAQADSE